MNKLEHIEFTFLMPCLNEEETIEKCISMAFDSIRKNNLSAEVLIADNGSTDNSVRIAKEMGARVVHVVEKGYGNALRTGIENAGGKYIIMGDSDCSYDFSEITLFIEKLRTGYELVMGNRFKGGIMKGAMPFLHRYLGNPVLSFIGRLFFRVPVGDFHCGLRGFNKSSIIKLGLVTGGMEFASEMVVKASLNKLRITEVPTILHPDGRTRPPHLRTWNDGWRHLRFLLIYSPKWLFYYPGIILLLLGFILSSAITIRQVSIKNVHFDIHTLLYATTSLYVGFQLVSFFIFTKLYGTSQNLLPKSERFSRAYRFFTLERGLIIGMALFIAGIIISISAVLKWSNSGFGELNPSETLRLVIPASFLIITGTQIIINSFFISFLTTPTSSKNVISLQNETVS